jgi:hypothetical protein
MARGQTRQQETEQTLREIEAWEQTILRILVDGHKQRIALEKELKELKMRNGPDLNARFTLSLALDIAKQSSKGDRSNNEGFSETRQVYRDLSYAEIVAVQKAVVDSLIGLGMEIVEEAK